VIVHLVKRQRLLVLELVLVVGGQGVVDAAAEEHRAARRRPLALDVVAPPGLGQVTHFVYDDGERWRSRSPS
jgi:hypothetical protein